MDGEVPLLALLSGPRDFVYCLPVLQPGKRLRFAPWRHGDPLVQNRFGIPEPDLDPGSLLDPEALDHVLLPLVGFDGRGHRLGTGGGYYDRSFAFRHGALRKPRLVGIGYACQQVDALPAADWDVPLDLIATERGLLDPQRN
jgi:5-formyltetrahydrofolate cyclo-ligase